MVLGRGYPIVDSPIAFLFTLPGMKGGVGDQIQHTLNFALFIPFPSSKEVSAVALPFYLPDNSVWELQS